jgi:hypothetical protein
MKKLVSLLALGLVSFWVCLPVGAEDEKTPTVKEIMGKLHKGPHAALNEIKVDLQDATPDWPEIQRLSKDLTTLGAALTKNDPPRGDKGAWGKLTKKYADNAKALDDAAKKKDAKDALAYQGKLMGSCTECHKAHRPR